jgi:hypothetical protein
VAGVSLVVAWNGGAISKSRAIRPLQSWRFTFWYIGFPLLECGPTGPLGPSAVFGLILTNKR